LHRNDFGYNLRSEVTNAVMRVVGQTTNTYAYAYDPIGNRLSASRNLDDLTYVSNGQTIEPTYDADGNLLTYNGWTFTWNGENRLATATDGTVTLSFSYDYMGRRIAKAIAGGATFAYTYDGWNLLRERKTVGGTSATKDFIWGLDLSQTLQGAGGVGGLLSVILPGETPLETFAVYDANGNVTEYVNASGTTVAHYEYDPFGGISRQTGALADEFPHRFSTKYLDSETGLVYYGYRFYSPELSRFLSRDPTGEEVTFHLYAFVLNDPVNQADMLGLMCRTDRYNADLGRLFDVVSRLGGCSITAFLRADIERCDKCCDDGRYLDLGKVKASFSSGGGISCRFPVPGLSIPAIGVGVFGTFSGTVKFGGAAEYDGCTDVTTGSGSGDVIIFLGLQAALMNNWAVELSLTGEGGGSCSLSMTCANRQCDLYGQCCLRARARLVARLWFASYQRIGEAPRLCTPRARIASFSL